MEADSWEPKNWPHECCCGCTLVFRNNVIACAKHFVGDGGTKKGKNEDDTICSFEKLEEIHMKPYLDCLSQGVSTVMASYSSWNGIKLHSHRFLITEILKEKLGFMGFVISDWEAIDHLSQPYGSDYKLCVSGSINAGIDMVMVPFRYKEFLDNLICLVKSGEIPISRIDDAVQRILRVKFVAGLFEHPFSDRSLLKFVGCKEHRQLACEAVRKSIVLLKNGKESEKPFLPLNRSAGDILIAGTHAHDIGYLCGGWTIAWGGGKGPITTGTTILDAITKTAGKHVGITYEEFPAETTFEDKQFSYAIVAVGEVPYSESVGDRSYLDIQLQGAEIVKYVSSKLPTLVILISGRPLLLEPELLDNVDAVVAAWLPGTEAEGIADVLFGDYEFEGVLPMTWFKRMDQLPINAGQEIYDPLFPLGYGLKMNVGAHEAD